MRLLPTLSVFVSLASALPPVATAASAADLASHRAAYRLTLDTSKPNQEIESATGAMLYEVIDQCDGWTVRQRFTLAVTTRQGQGYEMTSDYLTWESRDGKRLRFRLRQATDGAITQTLIGEALLPVPGAAGEVKFEGPDDRRADLPAGTVFPMDHTARLIAAADGGKRSYAVPIFDGTSADGAQDSNAAIIARIGPEANAGFPDLSSLPSWRVRIAFFEPGNQGGQPEYEVGMRYWANGVADQMNMDFGEFVIDGRMQQLEILPTTCN